MRPARSTPVLALALALTSTAGCGAPADRPESGGASAPAPPAARPTIRVAAASDLRNALPPILEAFASERGVEVVPVFGASGQLAAQVRQGAPYDLFLSADEGFVRELAEGGLVDPGSVRHYARGRLVLAVAAEAVGMVKGLDDLATPGVRRVAIANPAFAPYGRAAKAALQSAGLWDRVEPEVVLGETVRQAVQFVETGDADAGLVAHSVASPPPSGVAALDVDPGLYPPIVQALGVVASSQHKAEAAALAESLAAGEGQAALRAAGFLPAGDAGR